MKIDLEVLKKLEGVGYCGEGVIEFTPSPYKEVDESLWPVFKCEPLTNGETSKVRAVFAEVGKRVKNMESSGYAEVEKQVPIATLQLNAISHKIVGWDNLINLRTGDTVEYETSLIETLSERIIAEIFEELAINAGIIPRSVRGSEPQDTGDTELQQ